MNQRGIIPLKTGNTPALRVIDGGRCRADQARPEALELARALARADFTAMMGGGKVDSA